MRKLSPTDRHALITAIALRQGTARELAQRFVLTKQELKDFLAENREVIEQVSEANATPDPPVVEPNPTQLDDLWLTNKFERLKRIQCVADGMYRQIEDGQLYGDATLLREYRSYLALAANELGQLLHRGSGESASGDTLSVDIQGVDMDALR